MNSVKVQTFAFYLPQYHRTEFNDHHWGPCYTDWDRVTAARPRFADHYQPHRAGGLGEYDLRDPAIVAAQADLAIASGLDGFIYYHYWSLGRRQLEQPICDLMNRPSIDLPFAVCWANESWTDVWGPTYGTSDRQWRGDAVLFDQRYSVSDDAAHFKHLVSLMTDRRYIRVRGRPLLIIWRAGHLPDTAATVQMWRSMARDFGFGGLYVCAIAHDGLDLLSANRVFDAVISFEPNRANRHGLVPQLITEFGDSVFGYDEFVKVVASEAPEGSIHQTVFPGWDNSPRRQHGATIFHGSTPEAYGRWLHAACAHALDETAVPPLVFVNAWNEWAEGAHLEPDGRSGYAYLEEHKRVTDRFRPDRPDD